MSREAHVRFWESAEVKSLRATRLHRDAYLLRQGSASFWGRFDAGVGGAGHLALKARPLDREQTGRPSGGWSIQRRASAGTPSARIRHLFMLKAIANVEMTAAV